MKKFNICLCLNLICLITYGQTFEWVKKFQPQIGGDIYVESAVRSENQPYIYVSGFFYGSVDFDPDTNVFILTALSYDAFLVKLDLSGNFLWAGQFGGVVDDRSLGVEVDHSGNVIVSGWFKGIMDCDPGPNMHMINANNIYDLFIIKLDTLCNFLWAYQDYALASGAIVIDSSDNIFTNGYNYFIKVSPTGNLIFRNVIDATGNTSVSYDSAGYIYFSGEFADTADFDPGAGTFNYISNSGPSPFIAKYDLSGNFVWAKAFMESGTFPDASIQNKVIARNNHIYAVGFFNYTCDFDPGPGTYNLTSHGGRDAFILCIDTNGNFINARNFGGPSDDFYSTLAVLSNYDVYIGGSFKDSVDFDLGNTQPFVIFSPETTGFMAYYDSSLNFVEAGNLGHTTIRSMYLDQNNNLYCAAYFWGNGDFDIGAGTYNLFSDTTALSGVIFKYSNVISGINNQFRESNEISIFPNPSIGNIEIELKNAHDEIVSIRVIDIEGRIIKVNPKSISGLGRKNVVFNIKGQNIFEIKTKLGFKYIKKIIIY